jgi:hypothetical protein
MGAVLVTSRYRDDESGAKATFHLADILLRADNFKPVEAGASAINQGRAGGM